MLASFAQISETAAWGGVMNKAFCLVAIVGLCAVPRSAQGQDMTLARTERQ